MRKSKRGFKNAEIRRSYIRLYEEELRDLLGNVLQLDKIRKVNGRKGVNFQFCCPFHGENRPSAGILLDGSGSMYGQCYTCGEKFSLPKLYAEVMQVSVHSAIEELETRYRTETRTEIMNFNSLKTYETLQEENVGAKKVLPRKALAPFRSGKETHSYYYDRGFTTEDVERFSIGWDRKRKRITIPFFHSNGDLAGFTGRAVLEQKLPSGKLSKNYIHNYGNEPKYFLYDNVKIGDLLYMSHDFPRGEKTAILVEGVLDVQWLKKIGVDNVLSTIIASPSINRDGSSAAKDILHELAVDRVILALDNDRAGRVGEEQFYDLLKDDFIVMKADYPEGYNDVMGDDKLPPLDKEQVSTMIGNAKHYGVKNLTKKLKRY